MCVLCLVHFLHNKDDADDNDDNWFLCVCEGASLFVTGSSFSDDDGAVFVCRLSSDHRCIPVYIIFVFSFNSIFNFLLRLLTFFSFAIIIAFLLFRCCLIAYILCFWLMYQNKYKCLVQLNIIRKFLA